ncbi:MAG TPA: ABC transporter permease [Spirochaetota bacterium]|nr:ABC transporter permease [Spirochaetota bacterium]HPC42504.1 ABC transporter permease [Spirochaetota bacterium]HPL16076.1 ABC transporter permease [Spirochaetota bacterium]HQF10123.1 ABC transporter permease [Spirochaetota bacterium]HQH98848.1 ABC transporter permease [Spirochaetota bacterium]
MNPRKEAPVEVMLAWRNVWKNKRRTVLTLLTIMVGCAMIIFSRAFQDGGYGKMIEDSIASNTTHIQIHEKGFWENQSIDYAFKPDSELMAFLRTSPAVSACTRRIHAAGLVSYGKNTYGALIQAVEPDTEKKVSNLHTTIQKGGRYLVADDGKNIIMGAALAKNLKARVGDTVAVISQGFDGSIAAANVTIVGIFKSRNPRYDQSTIMMSFNQAAETFTMMDYISSIAVRLKQTEDMEKVRDQLRRLTGSKPLEVMGWDELLPELIQHIVMDDLFAKIFYIVLLLIIAFGVLNTIQMSVFERRRELGIMMAIGTRPSQIVAMVLFESVYISFIGSLLGILLGSAISYYFTVFPIDFSEYQKELAEFNQITTILPTKLTVKNVITTAFFTFCIGVLFSIAPARRASRLKPLDAIRQL